MSNVWILSFRLKTLPLALSTIVVGNCLAYWQHHFDGLIFALTLLTAITLQILSNLANDYGDAIKGSDDSDRIGPLRAIQTGQISLNALKKGLIICTIVAILLGLLLIFVAVRSWQDVFIFLLLGLLSILAAINYTVGKKPYGYLGLGDLSVFIFFGFVAINGSFYLQTHTFYAPVLLPACAFGLLSTAVLNMNNIRDYHSDKKHHKRTVVVLIGLKNACYYHLALIFFAFLSLFLFVWIYSFQLSHFLFLLLMPFAIYQIVIVFRERDNPAIAKQLINMVKLTLICAILFGVSLIY